MRTRLLMAVYITTVIGCGSGSKSEPSKDAPTTATPTSATTPGSTEPPVVVSTANPTIYNSRELAKLLNLGELPQIKDTEVREKSAANLTATAIGKVPEVAEFYRKQMEALGWKSVPSPGVTINEEFGGDKFVKDGHIALLHLGKGFLEANDPPKTSLNFVFHGNLDARTLPTNNVKFPEDALPTMAVYISDNSIADEGKWTDKALQDAGWKEYSDIDLAALPTDKHISRSYFKQAYSLSVFISKYGEGNRTHVNYRPHVMPCEIPAPPDASKIEYDTKNGWLRCKVPGNLKTVGEFYQKAMLDIGYTALPSADPQPAYMKLQFRESPTHKYVVQLKSGNDDTISVDIMLISTIPPKKK